MPGKHQKRSRLSDCFRVAKRPDPTYRGETSNSMLRSPVSPQESAVIEKLWSELLERKSHFIIGSPLPCNSCPKSSAVSSLVTIGDGIPVLLHKNSAVEPFPPVNEKSLEEDTKAGTSNTDDCQDPKKAAIKKPLRSHGLRVRLKGLRSHIREAFHGNKRSDEPDYPVWRSELDAFWSMENSSEDESYVGLPLGYQQISPISQIYPQIQPDEKTPSSAGGDPREEPIFHWSTAEKIATIIDPGAPIVSSSCRIENSEGSTQPSKSEHKKNWDQNASQELLQMALQQILGYVIRNLLGSPKRDLLACKFLACNQNCSKKLYQKLEKTVMMTLRCGGAIDEWEAYFWESTICGLTEGKFERSFTTSLLEAKHIWSWEMVPYHRFSHICVSLSSDGDLSCFFKQYDQRKSWLTSLTQGIEMPRPHQYVPLAACRGLCWSQRLCIIADQILATSRILYDCDHEDIEGKVEGSQRVEYLQ